MLRPILLLTVVLAAALLAPPPSHAYKLGGKKWPTRTITYHSSATQYAEAIDAAVAAWNASGVRVRFKETSRSRAKLKIVSRSGRGPRTGPSGYATLGWTPVLTMMEVDGVPITGDVRCGDRVPMPDGKRHRVRCFKQGPQVWLDPVPQSQAGEPEIRQQMADVVAHELGHSLGLRHHHSRCAIMSYKRLDKCAAKAAPWQMRCRLLEHDDVAGAIKRYGGRARPLGQEFCDLYTPPAPATGLTATFDPELREIKATWVNGSTAALVGVLVQKDACARHDIPFGIPIQPVTPGTPGEDVEYVGDESGPHCVSVMTYDAEARVGPIASVWIDVPPQ